MKIELTDTGVLIDGVLKPWNEVCKILEAGLASEKAKQQPAKDEKWGLVEVRIISTMGCREARAYHQDESEFGYNDGDSGVFLIDLDSLFLPDGTPVMTADELAEKGYRIKHTTNHGWWWEKGTHGKDHVEMPGAYRPTELAARKAATEHCRKEAGK